MLRSYPKVYALGHRAISNLVLDKVFIQEKVDGSQISFGIVDGKLQARSHHKEIDLNGYHDKMFDKAVETILSLEDILVEGWIYRGEYLQKPKHNTLTYSRVPKNNIIIFDIDLGMEHYSHPEAVVEVAKVLGLEAVPTFKYGTISGVEELKELLETESCLGGTTIEGVVVKNYNRFGVDGHALMGKYVREDFKERNGETHKVTTKKDIITSIADSLRTEARWNKAIQHLKEKGELLGEPKDIGPLIKEINMDVLEEEIDYIKEKLFKEFWSTISKKITYGFPEWYKDQLANQQFIESDL